MKNWSPFTKILVVGFVGLLVVALVAGTWQSVTGPASETEEATEKIRKALEEID